MKENFIIKKEIFKGMRTEKEIERMREKNNETSITSFFLSKVSDGLEAPEFCPLPQESWVSGVLGMAGGTAPLTPCEGT